jgi:hypothetical protein
MQRPSAFEYSHHALLLLVQVICFCTRLMQLIILTIGLKALATCSHATFTHNTQQERDAAGKRVQP